MPSVYVDRDISGNGVEVWSGPNNQVIFATWSFSAVGVGPRSPDPTNPDRLLRAGWFAFGDAIGVISGAGDAWLPPIWMDFEDGFWTPSPAGDQTHAFVQVASRVRWALAPGCTARLYIFGF